MAALGRSGSASAGVGGGGGGGGVGADSRRVKELEAEVFAKSTALVEAGEKTLAVGRKLSALSTTHKALEADVGAARGALVAGIAGEDADASMYAHVPLGELVRLRTQNVGTEGARRAPPTAGSPKARRGGGGEGDGGDADAGGADGEDGGGGGGGGSGGVFAVEREMSAIRARNKKLTERVAELEAQVGLLSGDSKKADDAARKFVAMGDKLREEKRGREAAEAEIGRSAEKIEAMFEHIEKLMVHLKHEAAAKAKAYELQRRSEKDLEAARARNAALARKNAAREQAIGELREGAKILEDQLRLMDEKYIELRGKLDWTRNHGQAQIKKLQEKADKMKAKMLLAGVTTMGSGGAGMEEYDSRMASTAPTASGARGSKSTSAIPASRRGVSTAQPAFIGMGHGVGELADVPDGDEDPEAPWSTNKLKAFQRERGSATAF